ncbi:hypothetical protein HF086_005618 [Spodoptera exigua]|uniref:Modifier of mdg4 n=1 Tax=Spodoptera exigua TaxID=7107 RepID=A0A922MY36_SPOEX|nr:hypothetical protein HF086_005618 [Spodoptera exigua]
MERTLNRKGDDNDQNISAFDIQTYEMIPTKKGKFLLMFQGYTYSQQHQTRNYYCSKKDSGCKARLKLDCNGKILPTSFIQHLHPPPKYVVMPKGQYVKFTVPKIIDILSPRLQISVHNVTNGKAVDLDWRIYFLEDGYWKHLGMFHEESCMQGETEIRQSPEHCSALQRTPSSVQIPLHQWNILSCLAILINFDSTKSDVIQNLPVRCLKALTCFLPGHKYQFITSQMGKQLILIGGYTFSKPVTGNIWVCSTKNPACKAKLRLDSHQNIVQLYNEHPHRSRYRFFNGIYYRV